MKKENLMKALSISLSPKDIEKADRIKEFEQIQSRSELFRRLIDKEHERLKIVARKIVEDVAGYND